MMRLDRGTILSRVHSSAYSATSFNPNQADVLYGGGRFDSTWDDSYAFTYAARSDDAAVAETLLRDMNADDRGDRFLPKIYWRGRQLSRVRLTDSVDLISLRSGRDLAAIGQDSWLTSCGADEYPQTRAWAHWLRRICSAAAGIVWLSKRDPGSEVLVLFEDRCPSDLLMEVPGPLSGSCAFDDDGGFDWLRATLARYRVGIRRR